MGLAGERNQAEPRWGAEDIVVTPFILAAVCGLRGHVVKAKSRQPKQPVTRHLPSNSKGAVNLALVDGVHAPTVAGCRGPDLALAEVKAEAANMRPFMGQWALTSASSSFMLKQR